MIAPRASPPGRASVRLLSRRARRGEPLDPPVAEHLADCDACGARYAELAALHGHAAPRGRRRGRRRLHARAAARAAAADRPPDRARRPSGARHQLSRPHRPPHDRRVGVAHARRAGSPPRRPPGCSSASRSARRIESGAAARRAPPTRRRASAASAAAARADAGRRRASHRPGRRRRDDDAFLSELELALERPHTRELQRVRRAHAARARDQRSGSGTTDR